jgi:MazG family protein
MEKPARTAAGEQFERLVQIMARLRSPDGCPWDRAQSFDTIKPYLLEETYEVLDSIDARDWPALCEELGDLLLQSVFFAQMASEQKLFRIEDSLAAITEKLIRRHPHVFGEATAQTPEEVKERWDRIKAAESLDKGRPAGNLLETVPRSQPALAEALQISSKVARVGFDWADTDQVIQKLHEELDELARARSSEASREAIEDELGDILFVIANIARHLRVDPEQALRKTNAKFRRRFAYLERRLAGEGKRLEETPLEKMEALWEEAKRAG